MLRHLSPLTGYKVRASRQDIGAVAQFLIDDQTWLVSFLVVDTSGYLRRSQALISPRAVHTLRDDIGLIETNLTREQIDKAPDVAANLPVSRRRELEYSEYFRWPRAWGRPTDWWDARAHENLMSGHSHDNIHALHGRDVDEETHLRLFDELKGYAVGATDGEFGHIDDLMVEDGSWAVRYLVVDTRKLWPGRLVLVPANWITGVDWDHRDVAVDLEKARVRQAPGYNPKKPFTRADEEALFAYYERSGYWQAPWQVGAAK